MLYLYIIAKSSRTIKRINHEPLYIETMQYVNEPAYIETKQYVKPLNIETMQYVNVQYI